MIDTFQAVVLGLVQGLTEYLPVSSSGHLVIAHHLFGLEDPAVFFDIILHIGTLVAVIWFYRAGIAGALSGSLDGLKDISSGMKFSRALEGNAGFRMAFLIVVGSVPTAVIGLSFKDQLESLFGSMYWTGVTLILNGLMLLTTIWAKDRERKISDVAWWEAALIGVAQGVAIIPAISRSGATITLALFMGIKKETAAEFSFLLSIPAILGALVLKFESPGLNYPLPSLAWGFTASLVSGYLCLILLVALLKKGHFSYFGYYCIALGGVILTLV
ncbi:MAG: hypothetical protein HY751_02665 [Nitrospinae bacterium]|nr:hypothetical protein [Nitrospinota bacterium]